MAVVMKFPSEAKDTKPVGARKLLKALRGEVAPAMTDYASVYCGIVVHDMRCARGITQTALAKKIGITPQRVSYIESGKAKQGLTVSRLMQIAEACDYRLEFNTVDLLSNDGASQNSSKVTEVDHNLHHRRRKRG